MAEVEIGILRFCIFLKESGNKKTKKSGRAEYSDYFEQGAFLKFTNECTRSFDHKNEVKWVTKQIPAFVVMNNLIKFHYSLFVHFSGYDTVPAETEGKRHKSNWYKTHCDMLLTHKKDTNKPKRTVMCWLPFPITQPHRKVYCIGIPSTPSHPPTTDAPPNLLRGGRPSVNNTATPKRPHTYYQYN